MKRFDWIMSALIAICFTMAGIGVAKAAEERTATLRWANPTEYVNGDPLDAADIAGYHIYWEEGSEPNTSSSRIDYPVTGGNNQYIATFMMTPRPEPYVYHFRITVYLADGRESLLSNTAIKDFGVVKSSANPGAIQDLSVE